MLCYCDGYTILQGYGDKERGYIATQGPTSHTVPDFWRMVWEEGVSIVVMTTPLAERGIVRHAQSATLLLWTTLGHKKVP